MSFAIKSKQAGETLLVRPAGDLDLSTAEVFADELKRIDETGDVTRIVVDMSAVPFVDSTGLRILLEGVELGQERGIDVTFESPMPQLRRLVDLTKTGTLLNLK